MGVKGIGRRPKPIKDHIRRGTYRKDRHDVKPQGVTVQQAIQHTPFVPLSCPNWFDEYAKLEWDRILHKLYNLGKIGDINHAILEGYCAAYSRAVRAEMDIRNGFYEDNKRGTKVLKKKHAVAIAEKAWAQVRMFALELGIKSNEIQSNDLTPLEKTLREAEQKIIDRRTEN